MKIYTRFGDGGKTSIYKGKVIWKDELIFEVLGDLDELNCFIGYCRYYLKDKDLDEILRKIQLDIYRANIEIQYIESGDKFENSISQKDVRRLEEIIDKYWSLVGDLRGFIIPYGSEPGMLLHITRTICRRFERKLVKFIKEKLSLEEENYLVPYFNRLSDLLFTLSRYVSKVDGYIEEYVKD